MNLERLWQQYPDWTLFPYVQVGGMSIYGKPIARYAHPLKDLVGAARASPPQAPEQPDNIRATPHPQGTPDDDSR